jgi:FeS assembly SUF system protein
MDNSPLKEQILSRLKEIFDPEIPVNMVDLGLIYEIIIQEEAVHIKMTLTNPACPVAMQFPEVVRSHIASMGMNKTIKVELVWDPPWTMDRMTDAAKLQLGLL